MTKTESDDLDPDLIEWRKLAYGEALRRLSEQRSARDAVRTRGLSVAAAVSATTGFMMKAALDGHKGIPWPAFAALCAFLLAALSGIGVGWPIPFQDNLDAQALLSDGWTVHTVPDRMKHLVDQLSGFAEANKKSLRRLHRVLAIAYTCAVATVLLWTLAFILGAK